MKVVLLMDYLNFNVQSDIWITASKQQTAGIRIPTFTPLLLFLLRLLFLAACQIAIYLIYLTCNILFTKTARNQTHAHCELFQLSSSVCSSVMQQLRGYDMKNERPWVSALLYIPQEGRTIDLDRAPIIFFSIQSATFGTKCQCHSPSQKRVIKHINLHYRGAGVSGSALRAQQQVQAAQAHVAAVIAGATLPSSGTSQAHFGSTGSQNMPSSKAFGH